MIREISSIITKTKKLEILIVSHFLIYVNFISKDESIHNVILLEHSYFNGFREILQKCNNEIAIKGLTFDIGYVII